MFMIMIKKIFLMLYFATVFSMIKAQTFDVISENSNPYKGGSVQFYKDLNKILIKNNLGHCSNKMSEMFLAEIEIVNQEAQIVNKNLKDDCPTKLFVSGISEINKLKKWKTNANTETKFSIIFYPIDYFENFKEGYTTSALKKTAEFPGGMGEFRNQLISKIKNQKIDNVSGLRIVLKFKVNQQGILNDVKVEEPSDLDIEIKNKIIKAVEQINQKWIPETFRGYPIISNYRIPIGL